MARFIPANEVLDNIRMLVQRNIDEYGAGGYNQLSLDLDNLSTRCRGEQEIKRFKWGWKVAMEAHKWTINNVWDRRPWRYRKAWALEELERCTEETYQREVVFAEMIDRVGWARMFKKPAIPYFYMLKWKEACKKAYVKFDIDEWIENEMLLDDFFS